MKVFSVRGGRSLQGVVRISGAKNAVLPLLAASVLCRTPCLLRGCPRLSDVDAALEILRHLGCGAEWEGGDIRVDPAGLCRWDIPKDLCARMRSSVLFLGPLLAAAGRCELFQPGGCRLGDRPIDLHLRGLTALGAAEVWEGDRLGCRMLHPEGAAIVLPFPSVGATENLLTAALGCRGTTTIYNAAREPEIGNLIAFLRAGGARIYGAGTGMLQIEGGLPVGTEHSVLPDRIETATFLCAAAAAEGHICLQNTAEGLLRPVCDMLRKAGCEIRSGRGELEIMAGRLHSPPPVRTAPYPGFPTDAQAPVMAALLRARGTTVVEERIFSSRYRHVPALRALGGEIRTSGRTAVVTGVESLHGAAMTATDLRGGAAMVVGALGAEGESRVLCGEHILRGYEALPEKLRALGGQVRMLENEKYGA